MIPGLAGVDLSAVVLMLVLKIVELNLLISMGGQSGSFGGIALLSVAELVSLGIDVFFWAIIIQVVISWVNPGAYNPVTSIIHKLTEPVLAPARRVIPPMGGFDLSPIAAIIVLKLAQLLLVAPVRDMALRMM